MEKESDQMAAGERKNYEEMVELIETVFEFSKTAVSYLEKIEKAMDEYSDDERFVNVVFELMAHWTFEKDNYIKEVLKNDKR